MSSYNWPPSGAGGGVPIYANIGVFPTGTNIGDLGISAATGIIYYWNGSSWIVETGPGAMLSIGTIDTGTPAANGAQDVSNQLILQSASVTVPGLVNLTTQSFAGNKTFTGTIAASNLSGTNTGDVTLAAFGSAPNANGLSLSGQVLNMQPASASQPGGVSTAAQTFAGIKTHASAAYFIDGTDAAPGVAFSSETGTGLVREAAGNVSLSVLGNIGLSIYKLSSTQFNLGFGGAAGVTTGSALSANYTYNGIASFNYSNLSQGSSAITQFYIGAGASGGNGITLENQAFASTAYTGGGGLVSAGPNLSFLNICAENGSAYMTFNVGGRTLATEAMRVGVTGTGGLTLNKGWGGLNISGSTSGIVSILPAAAAGTYNFNLPITAGSAGQVLTSQGGVSTAMTWSTAVSAVSVVSANGFTGTSSGGQTPALTLTTSITGVLKGNGTAISAATSGTDYSAGTSALATGIVKSTTATGALTIAVAGDFPTLNQNTTGTANIAGGAGGAVCYQSAANTTTTLANGSANQYLASAGGTSAPVWTTFAAPTIQTFGLPSSTAAAYYTFTVSSANATIGATYTNNGATFAVAQTISAETRLVCSGTGVPTSGTTSLIKSSGTGDATINVTSNVANGTYVSPTSPKSPLYIRVRMVGAGGGGGGSGTGSPGVGGTGGNTTFGSSLLAANGGAGGNGVGGSAGGAGGTASLGTGPTGLILSGATGGGNSVDGAATLEFVVGGMGGSSAFGGAGYSGPANAAGGPGISNTGGGGGGAGTPANASSNSGSGGGAGGFVDALISSPSATYVFQVGNFGSGGTAGTAGFTGGNGGTGTIEVTEYYQ